MRDGHFVHRLCANVHRLCVETRLGYTAYAHTGTPLMRGNLAGFTPECGYFRRTAATVPLGLRLSYRRQGHYRQCEKPASAIAGAGVPS
jgi:hypothetical protein